LEETVAASLYSFFVRLKSFWWYVVIGFSAYACSVTVCECVLRV
jgi:hypothetical protein